MLLSMGALTYFHLSLASHDNLTRTDLAGRKLAALVVQRVQIFMQASPPGATLDSIFHDARAVPMLEGLSREPGMVQWDVFLPDGTALVSMDGHVNDGLQVLQALQWINERHESYAEIWGHQVGRPAELLAEVPALYQGQVVHHSYHPLLDPQGQVKGVLHLALLQSKAPLRMNLIVLGYLTVAAIFLGSSMISVYLWAEFALNRPLRGLSESLQQLHSLHPSGNRPDRLPQPNELSEAARALNHVTLDLVKYQRELKQNSENLERANQSLAQLNEELEQRVAEKTLQIREFFSLITHDLRVPLAAVSGYAELLGNPRGGVLTDKQQRYLQHIQVGNSHAQELTRNLLEAMKYEFGQPALEGEMFDLRGLTEEVRDQLAVQERPIQITAPEGSDYLVWGDRNRLRRVLGNLLANALAHAGAAEVVLRPASGQVEVEVLDQGPGIPPEQMGQLFAKFKSAGSNGSSSGLGLGLYIVKRILEDHGQDIRVSSQLGRGTRFWFAVARTEKSV